MTGSLLDAQDRAQWLLERKRYQEALAVADNNPGVPLAMRQQACGNPEPSCSPGCSL